MVSARARFLARPRYRTLVKTHNCLTRRKACSPQARVRPLDHAPALAQRPPGGGPPVDPITYSARLKELAVVFFPVGLIAEDLALLSVQKLRQLRDIGDRGS